MFWSWFWARWQLVWSEPKCALSLHFGASHRLATIHTLTVFKTDPLTLSMQSTWHLRIWRTYMTVSLSRGQVVLGMSHLVLVKSNISVWLHISVRSAVVYDPHGQCCNSWFLILATCWGSWKWHFNSVKALFSTVWQQSSNSPTKGINKVCHYYHYSKTIPRICHILGERSWRVSCILCAWFVKVIKSKNRYQ